MFEFIEDLVNLLNFYSFVEEASAALVLRTQE